VLLNCHTYYSFRYGTLSPAELVSEVKEKGHDSLVLSDINNTSAILETLRLCNESGIRCIAGIDFRNGVDQQYVGIAINNAGYSRLNSFLSFHLHEQKIFPKDAPVLDDVFFVYPLKKYSGKPLGQNEWLGISTMELSTLPFSPYRHLTKKMIVLQSVSFIHKFHFNAHRLLRAIDNNTLLSKLPPEEQGSLQEIALKRSDLKSCFSGYPEICENTDRIVLSCKIDFTFDKLGNRNLKHFTESIENDLELLRNLAMEGIQYRYPNAGPEVATRIEKELAMIAAKNFASYFLINWDLTRYARSKNYYYVGRGSGANSIVAYLLRITDVDPIDLDLYFERFINEHRSNAPDFDMDFSWTDRDDVTRYIFDKYGAERTALLATYSTFQYDAITRELGKVFGLPPQEIDKLQKAGSTNADDLGKLVLKYAKLIEGFPNHLSVHASGIIISEEPVVSYTATILPPKGYPTTQFSMIEAEDIGLFKFDILSQRGLGKIKDAVALVDGNCGVKIDIHDVRKFKQDENIKKLLRIGDCIGCFYVESPAMRMLLAKLEADDYLRLVAASSIIRPGVSKSGMMREYIVRYRDHKKRELARNELPELYDLLAETYGVMVYQEDVIKIAHLFAGLSLADADYLRRGMSWKFKQRNEFQIVREKFFESCRQKKYPDNTITGIWDQIESFANFAFSKGHSASYAVESYQALYLKAYFPLEYMVATLNNGGGYYRKDIYLHEARMRGATVIPPCINRSDKQCSIKGKNIVLGFDLLTGLEEGFVHRILRERNNEGLFTGLCDFIKRVQPPIEQIRILIRIGAFASFNSNKKAMLWEAHMLINPVKKTSDTKELFDIESKQFNFPRFENSWLDDALDEIELLGFALCSPFHLIKEKHGCFVRSKDLKSLQGQKIEIAGYLVTVKNTNTGNGQRMFFGTFLDEDGHWIDTVHFPGPARNFPFTGPGCYKITGIVKEEFDYLYVEVMEQHRLPVLNRDDVPQSETIGFSVMDALAPVNPQHPL
jgi:DNA polymerase-3 subunit alpha